MDTYSNYIDGTWVPSRSGRTFENRNPADRDDVIGLFQDSSREDVEAAVHAAERAYCSWRLVPAPKRAEMLFAAAQIIAARKEAFARDMTREMGKVLEETRGDVQEAIDMTYFMAGEGRRQYGQTVPSELRDKFAMSVRQPLGVCSIITPWNFPMAIPSWKIVPALVCGNTVVFKPATLTPLSAVNFVKVLEEAGIPPGVVNLVTGGPDVGELMTTHDAVKVVSFTGSTTVGRIVNQHAASSFKKTHLEMGGKNVVMIMDDAQLELAVEGCLWGGFGTTGQRCTAASRVVVHEQVYDEFLRQFTARASALRVGNGLDDRTQMGPSVSESQLETVMKYVADRPRRRGTTGHGREPSDVGIAREWMVPRADDFRRCRAVDADRAGGDLRSRRVGDALPIARTGDRDRQRRRVRPVGVDLHARHQQGVRGDARHVHGDLLRERADDWGRGAPAVRRHEDDGQRSSRGGHRRARRVLGVEVDLRGLQRQAAARAD